MKYEIIMPVSRWVECPKIYKMLKEHGVNHWHILLKESETCQFSEEGEDYLNFVTCYKFMVPPPVHPGLWLVNQFIQTASFHDHTWYQFLCDDDWLPPDFEKCLPDDDTGLVIVSMKRGDGDGIGLVHPTWTLMSSPQSLHYGYCGMEQGIFKGFALSRVAQQGINPAACNEAVLFKAATMVKTLYVPDVHVWFNYLEPGRWRKDGNPG